MFGGRKSALTIALTVVMMLAMLVPVATAAPEYVHGVDITSPTGALPVYVDPTNPAIDDFVVKFNLNIVETQFDDVYIRVWVLDANDNTVVWPVWQRKWWASEVHTGVNALQTDVITPATFPWTHGWYDVQVCVMDGDWNRKKFCDVETMAVLIDQDDPGTRLLKPAWNANVSGKEYLMVGKAWDPWYAENESILRYGGIAKTEFSYCVITNWQGDWCGPDDKSWVKLGDGVPSGVVDEWQYVWDSTQAPDDLGWVRFCAWDLVGRKSCSKAPVIVVNHFTIGLRPGWNLISTPLMLYEPEVADVLHHLVDSAGNPTWQAIYTVDNLNADEPDEYKWYMASPGGVGDLATIDAGKGYWINMKTVDWLTFEGAWKDVGPVVPPEYQVYEGWNLIGYTHWGQPTWQGDKLVADYLGMPLAPSVEALWIYDTVAEQYWPMYLGNFMVKGAGYWLATAEGGSINP